MGNSPITPQIPQTSPTPSNIINMSPQQFAVLRHYIEVEPLLYEQQYHNSNVSLSYNIMRPDGYKICVKNTNSNDYYIYAFDKLSKKENDLFIEK